MNLMELENRISSRFDEYVSYTKEQKIATIKAKASHRENAIIGFDLIAKMLESSNPLSEFRVKWGIDPTASYVHLGHIVPILMLKRLHIFGFSLDVIVGDFTATVGDPSDRMSERKALTQEEVKKNADSYFDQISKVFNINQKNIEKHYNSKWLNNYSLENLIIILQRLNLTSLLQREDFRKRVQAGNSMSVAEILYPILMGLDSVALKSDIEVGGIDQMLNFHVCREVMSSHNMRPEAYITTDLVPGISGERTENGELAKMSKSKGNYIAINDSAENIYGKTMSIPDETMWLWFDLLTEITEAELQELKNSDTHPKEIKKMLARCIARLLGHNDEAITKCESDFETKFSKKEIPENIKTVLVEGIENMTSILAENLSISKSELYRLDEAGAIKLFHDDNFQKSSILGLKEAFEDKGEATAKIGKVNFINLKKSS